MNRFLAATKRNSLAVPSVPANQAAGGGLVNDMDGDLPTVHFTEREAAFIAMRDSFYLASVSPSGWPYIQHRGGPPGFLAMLNRSTLAFADYRGNRQYISLGNVADDDRVALFLMDYPSRKRLKVLAHMSPFDLAAEPDLAARLAYPGYRAISERGFKLQLEAFDWNCPQHITPRFTAPELEEAVAPLRTRLALLETENAELRHAAEAR